MTYIVPVYAEMYIGCGPSITQLYIRRSVRKRKVACCNLAHQLVRVSVLA